MNLRITVNGQEPEAPFSMTFRRCRDEEQLEFRPALKPGDKVSINGLWVYTEPKVSDEHVEAIRAAQEVT